MKTIENALEALKKQGCCDIVLEQLHLSMQDQNITEMIRTIKEYQEEVQQMFDEVCKQIDCIDFLIYELEKSVTDTH